jgi:MFS family permease
MVASTVGGQLGDRIGLGRMLAIGLAVEAIGTGLIAVGGDALEATIAVALAGVGAALAWPSLNGMVASQLPAAARSHAYALRFGILNAGIGIGGLASGWVISLDHPDTFALVYTVDAASTFVFASIVFLGMRNSPGFRPLAAPPAPGPVGEAPAVRGYRAVLSNRPFVGFLVCALLLGVFGYAQLNGPWAAFATLIVGATPRTVGIAFAVNTAVIVGAQLVVVRLTRRWRRSRLLGCTAAFWTAAWLVTGLSALPALHGLPADIALVASLGMFGLGETFLSPVNGALPNDLAPDHLRARYNALASSTWPLGGLIGPPIAGALLGSPLPTSWVLVIAVGAAVAGVVGLGLGRVLPARTERPLVEAPAG